MYSILNKPSDTNTVWERMKCGMANISTPLLDTTVSLETDTRFDSLYILSDPKSLIPHNIAPTFFSFGPHLKPLTPRDNSVASLRCHLHVVLQYVFMTLVLYLRTSNPQCITIPGMNFLLFCSEKVLVS